MSNLIRCDQCRTELREEHHPYYMLERAGLDVLGHDEPPGPFHFCSWRCVWVFAESRVRA